MHDAVQRSPDLEDVFHFRDRKLRDVRAAVRQDAHDRILLQDAQRFAYRTPADFESLGQHLFADAIARRVFAS